MDAAVSIAHESGPKGPAGWATVRPRFGGRATVWRAGRGAGALAALFMLAAETDAAGKVNICGGVTGARASRTS